MPPRATTKKQCWRQRGLHEQTKNNVDDTSHVYGTASPAVPEGGLVFLGFGVGALPAFWGSGAPGWPRRSSPQAAQEAPVRQPDRKTNM